MAYVSQLSDTYKKYYLAKLKKIGDVDPYEDDSYVDDINIWPDISYIDTCNYLVFSTNSVTMEKMKSYKSLEAHNFFTSGLVDKKIYIKNISSDLSVLLGMVHHSQSFNVPKLRVWIAAKPSGEVITAHCTCMAGLGESCSHVGALLFAIFTRLRIEKEKSCTDEKNAWLEPKIKEDLKKRVRELDFSSAAMKKKKTFLGTVQSPGVSKNTPPKAPTEAELASFFSSVAATGDKSAVLSILPTYAHIFKKNKLFFKSLYNADCSKMSLNELNDYCHKLFNSLEITEEESSNIAEETKGQAKSKIWFQYRAGRITASIMKAACHSSPEKPAISLINKICYPESYKIINEATAWGCNHEILAFEAYKEKMQTHTDFAIRHTGFCINPKFPHVGATPDGVIECSCCGKGVLEIKCPFCIKKGTIMDLAEKKTSCLQKDELDNVSLKKEHSYYYQVQTQIFVCEADFCDFVIWTENEMNIERIYPDEIFWEEIETKCTQFFVQAVLPEIVIQWHSKKK